VQHLPRKFLTIPYIQIIQPHRKRWPLKVLFFCLAFHCLSTNQTEFTSNCGPIYYRPMYGQGPLLMVIFPLICWQYGSPKHRQHSLHLHGEITKKQDTH
jgi:hypothetical protein